MAITGNPPTGIALDQINCIVHIFTSFNYDYEEWEIGLTVRVRDKRILRKPI